MTKYSPNREPFPAEHLVPVPGCDWVAWKCVGLRGAGFRADQALSLSAPECSLAAYRLIESEESAQGARNRAISACQRGFDSLSEDERASAIRTLRQIKKGKIPRAACAGFIAQEEIDALKAESEKLDLARADFKEAFESARLRVSHEIRSILQKESFREAIIWQNRSAFHRGVAAILRKSEGDASRPNKQRQNEELVASYLQRYCTKNDTIGFFGPVGWARINSSLDSLKVQPGKTLLSSRDVYFAALFIAVGRKVALI